ncbi:MAG: PD40 domain-containing protein, partial [Anaerolineae bacterium]|nr:PD40 domain-containing protein [Anaerolineae bacterium]
DTNGGNLRQITFNSSDDRYPAWSPNGSRLAFASNRDGNWELYTMDPYGNGVARLTYDNGTDWGAAWSPDGTQLLFASDRDGDNEIFLMNADGSNPTQITFNSSDDELPVFLTAGSPVNYWMVITNMEGNVAAGPVGGQLQAIAPGQHIRVGYDAGDNIVRVEPPAPAGITYRSAVTSWLTFDPQGISSLENASAID